MADEFKTPVGRIVWNRVWEPITKDMNGAPLVASDGSPRSEKALSLAISKNNPEWDAFWGRIVKKAAESWPNGAYQQPGFSWKYVNGDDPKYAQREGYPGHHIITMKTNFENFAIFSKDYTRKITDPREMKCGDFVECIINVASNGKARNPGMYLNLCAIHWMYLGEEIVSVDYSEAFKTAPNSGYVPSGIITTPGVPATPTVPGVPATPATPAVPPAPGFLSPSPQFKMTEKAGGYSREQYLAQPGWTDELLIQQGFMIKC